MRWLLFALLPSPALADALVATQIIPARSVISAAQVTIVDAIIDGALADPSAAIGLEARVTIFPGRPLRPGDIGAPALVDRNSIVPLRYHSGGLLITAEGRALDRAAEGEAVRVMNLSSRTIVTGRVAADGAVTVEP